MRTMIQSLLILLLFFNIQCKQVPKADPAEATPIELIALKPQLISVLDDEVAETSGLIYFGNFFWTINDSGNQNILYRISPQNGEVVTEIRIKDSENVDWEELTHDDVYIYIADMGDNSRKRDEKQIYRIRKADVLNARAGDMVNSEIIFFTYPEVEGKKVSYDAEALISYNGVLHLFTKDLLETQHFTISPVPGKTIASFVEKFKTNGQVTGAAIDPQSHTLILVGYLGFGQRLFWEFKGFDKKSLAKSSVRYFTLGAVDEAGQMEAVCFSPEKKVYISNENSGNLKQQLWNLPYPIK